MKPMCYGIAIKRQRLVRSLGLRAICGVSVYVVLALVLLVLAGFLLLKLQQALLGGQAAETLLYCCLFLPVLFCCLRVGRWVLVQEDLPSGVLLERSVAPRLYRVVDRMCASFNREEVVYIWITPAINAAVLQRPRHYGVFGRLESHLLIGLPLLHSVSRQQFRAILAHELAHLFCQRQGMAAWARHCRSWWFRIIDRSIDDVPLLAPLMERCAAGFMRSSARLSRMEEYEADEIAARLVGTRGIASALIEVALKGRFLREDYWEKIVAQCIVRPKPSIRPYREMALGMVAGFRPPQKNATTLAGLLHPSRSPLDFHPSLRSRLRMLGVRGNFILKEKRVASHSAASHYLQDLLPRLSWEFDRAWWCCARSDWRYQYRCALRKRRSTTEYTAVNQAAAYCGQFR